MPNKSSTVGAAAAARRKQAKPKGLVERLLHYFSHQTLPDALRLGAAVPLVGVLFSTLPCLLGAPSVDGSTLLQLVVSLGEMLAGIAGLLFAVIIFGVEFEAERSGTLAPLTRYIHKQRGVVGQAAFVMGVVATTGVLPAFGRLGVPINEVAANTFVTVLFLLSLTSILCLLYVVAFPALSSIQERIRHHLSVELRERINSALVCRQERQLYEEELTRLRLPYRPWGWPLGDEIEISLEQQGVIGDVDLRGLEALASALRRLEDRWEYAISTGPYTDAGWPAVALRAKPSLDRVFRVRDGDLPEAQSISAGHPELEPSERQHLLTALRRAFKVERPSDAAKEFGFALVLLIESLEDDASSGVGAACRAKLETLQRLISEWVAGTGDLGELLTIGDDSPRMFPKGLDSTLGPLVAKANGSKNGEVLLALEVFLLSGLREGVRAQNLELVRQFVRLGTWHYRMYAERNEETQSAPQVDRYVSLTFATVRQAEPAVPSKRLEIYLEVYAGVARMLRHAFEVGRKRDFVSIYTQVMDGLERPRGAEELGQGAGVSADELPQVLGIVIAGWCLKRAQEDPARFRSSASKAACLCASRVPSSVALAKAWEAAVRQGLPARLGVESWESELREIRPGFVNSGFVDIHWYRAGLAVLAILQEQPITVISELPLDETTPEDAWDPRDLRERVAAIEGMHFGLPAVDYAARRERFLGHVETCAMCRTRKQLEALLAEPISAERVEELRKEIESARPGAGGIAKVLKRLEVTGSARVSPFRPGARWHLPKQEVVAQGDRVGRIEQIIQEGIGQRADVQSFGTLEQMLLRLREPKAPETSPGTVQNDVRAELGRQRAQGAVPDLIVLPRGLEWQTALLAGQGWQETVLLGPNHVGEFEGCQVIEWPHDNASTVMVAQSRRVFGWLTVTPTVQVSVQEMPTARASELRARAAAASTIAAMPRVGEVFVVCDVHCDPSIGFDDIEAAVCIPIGLGAGA